jgi:hypothetical protein
MDKMQSLGLKTVTTHGTPVQLTTTDIFTNKLSIQAIKAVGATGVAPTSNVGAIYLMAAKTAKGAAGTDVIAIINADGDLFTLQSPSNLGFDLANYYLDADNDGDGALISYATPA